MVIKLLVPYFGGWPEWMSLWLRSCAHNIAFEWHLYGETPPEGIGPLKRLPDNVIYHKLTLKGFAAKAAEALGIKLNISHAYKVCDLRPCFGVIFADDLKGADFWGHTDLDVLYGDLDKWYTDAVLQAADMVSVHQHCSGHFCLYRNREEVNNHYRIFPDWKDIVSSPEHFAFDERPGVNDPPVRDGQIRYVHLLDAVGWRVQAAMNRDAEVHLRNVGMTRADALAWPHAYYWLPETGKVYDSYDREYAYLHFMVWRGGKWGTRWGGGQWADRATVLNAPKEPGRLPAFRVDAGGITQCYWQPSSRPIINALWIEGALSHMEQLTAASFVRQGHPFYLWHYGQVSQVPNGVITKDAREILPVNRVFRYQRGWGAGSYAGFSDIFRYALLFKQGGWYTDMDVTCRKPLLHTAPYVFPSHHLGVVGNLMRAPQGSECFGHAYAQAAAQVTMTNTDWELPIKILNQQVQMRKLTHYIDTELALQDWETAKAMATMPRDCPDRYWAIHWSNEMWKHHQMAKDRRSYSHYSLCAMLHGVQPWPVIF